MPAATDPDELPPEFLRLAGREGFVRVEAEARRDQPLSPQHFEDARDATGETMRGIKHRRRIFGFGENNSKYRLAGYFERSVSSLN